ncbi:MAG: beta-N-acetylhexosaminidase [Proteobacteria bacterium]|nr:beta-N-acetylhexosaminidase [Pseudomonadota bacterium]
MTPNAVIFGCEGPVLNDWERDFFSDHNPLGFILFARNCEDPEQVRALVAALRATIGRAEAPVLIDQEGGRVARLKPPHWRAPPAPGRFGLIAGRDRERAHEAVRLNARLIAADLMDLGITVDCAPALDLPTPGADAVIGDRAFGADAEIIADLGRAFCEGLLAGGVLPVIKHMPGHGRARVDSHLEMPVVEAPRAELEMSDFRPFTALADAPWAMTGHVVYAAIDPDNPATTSRTVIGEVIRGLIGFDGVLVTDDLSMGALAGNFADRAAAALEAGCDLVLHCNGEPDEMTEVARGVTSLSAEAERRLAAAAARPAAPETVDRAVFTARLERLLDQSGPPAS